MCKYLKEVHTVSRMTWKCAKDDLKVHKEDLQKQINKNDKLW